MSTIGLIIISILVGLCVGVLSGLLGIGGGVIMVPIFRLAFLLEPISATATSLFCILPTALTGVATHIRHRTCAIPFGIAMGIGGALLSPVGVWLATVSPNVCIMGVTAIIMVYSSVTMFRKAHALSHPAPSTTPGASNQAEQASTFSPDAPASAPEPEPNARHLCIAAAVGAFAGLCSGYVGVGGGFIMVPLMISLLGMPMKKASGTSLIAVAILAIPSVITQAVIGNITYAVGIGVVCGSIPGAALGARLVSRVPERALRLLFGALLVVVAIVLVANELLF